MGERSTKSALVTAAYGRRGLLESDGVTRPFVSKGRQLRAACGDLATFEHRAGSEDLLVTAIQARRNALRRQPERGEEPDVIAANLSQLVLVCCARPEPDLFLLDRYLCAAQSMGCRTLLLWNKRDLGEIPTVISTIYSGLVDQVSEVSTRNRSGIEELTLLLQHQVSILVGQSGVGKSSLVNALVPDAAASIGSLSSTGQTGTHTTTAVLMYRIGATGRLVDAPGVRDFLPLLDSANSVASGFLDIATLGSACRFGDCRHVHEPGCAVKAALAAGALPALRYQSYLKLLEAIEAARDCRQR